jgi:hypothetical protein
MSNLMTGLETLKTLSPSLGKSHLYKVLEYLVIGTMIYGVYADASASLTTAKAHRDEQIKGYSVQIGYTRTEIERIALQQGLDTQEIATLKAENERLRNWLKANTERVNRLEDVAIRRHR